jgi:hypothetical protein
LKLQPATGLKSPNQKLHEIEELLKTEIDEKQNPGTEIKSHVNPNA